MRPVPLSVLSLLLHAYVGWRVAPALGSTWASVAFAALLIVSAVVLPFGFSARRAGVSRRRDGWLAWAGLLSMGLFSSLFVLTVLRDAALLVAAVVAAAAPAAWRAWPAGSRLDLVVDSARLLVVAALLATAWGFVNARRTAAVVRVDVPLPDLPLALHGFSIAQISDVHVGPTIKRPYVESIVAAVNALDADLVAVTGDLVDGS